MLGLCKVEGAEKNFKSHDSYEGSRDKPEYSTGHYRINFNETFD